MEMRFSCCPFIIALPLLAVLLIATPVFAQDELPPEAPVPTEEIPIVEEIPITEPIPTEVAPPGGSSRIRSRLRWQELSGG